MLRYFLTAAMLVLPVFGWSQESAREANDLASESPAAGDPFEPTRVLAIVGSEPIFVGDLLFEVNQLLERFAPGAPESVKRQQRGELVKRLLPRYVEQRMLLIDVKRGLPEGAKFDDIVETASKEFDDKALEELMKSAGVDSPTMFDAHLRAQGSSLRKLRYSWTVNQVVRYFLQQKINTEAQVSHQELLQYYRDHRSDYELKARARWEQVMLRRDRFATGEQAQAAMVELGNKIVYGASLAGVAKKSSHGYRASDGGQHDWTNRGSLVLKELDAAIFSLPVGQLSDIIKTDRGYHIVRVLEREDAGLVDFREAQVEIKKKLESEKRVAAYDEHLEQLKQDIPVEYVDTAIRTANVSNATLR